MLLAKALNDKDGTRTVGTAYAITISIIANSPIANAIYESDDCFVVFEMESETEAWGIGKVIERFIQVTEDGDVEHLNMAAPSNPHGGRKVCHQCPQVQVPLRRKHRKSSSVTHLPSGLSLVQSQVERRASAMQ